MQVTPITCGACSQRLFEAVLFCPYCGAATASTAPTPDIATALPTPPAPPEQAQVETLVEVEVEVKPAKADAPNKPQAAQNESPPPKPQPPPSQAKPPKVDAAPIAPVAPAKPSESKRSMTSTVVVLAAILAAGYWLFSGPTEQEIVCNTQLALAAELLATGDAAGARSQSVLALASCDADSRSKAADLQAGADKALVVRAKCEKGLRRADTLATEHRLQSATSAIDRLDTACTDLPQAKQLQTQIDAGKSSAASAEADMRQKLTNGDLKGARVSLGQVSAANREHPEIAALRTELQKAVKTQEEAVVAAAAAVAAVLVPATPAAASTASAPPATNNAAAASQRALVNGFLRDAEIALSELKFDKAKTYVESASRVDPANSRAIFLWRQIRERELEYARKEMTIN